ncbi:unnamed protein product, partial [Candidula unifasciata]
MIRKETDRPSTGGRRPLLVTFVGNNRLMLNEIRDSLSHLRKHDLDGSSPMSNLQLRPELSQSTPNLLEKSAGNKVTRRDNQHHKALAEIRDSLRPYQNVSSVTGGGAGGGSGGSSADNSSSSASSTSSRATNDADSSSGKVEQIMQFGFDEDIAVRALQLSGNQSVNAALRLLFYIMDEKLGFPGFLYSQLPHLGPSSPVTSDTNSVRSDSPTLSSSSKRPVVANGLLTPPPLPPRAPIATQNNRALHSYVTGTFSDSPANGTSQQPLCGPGATLLQTLNQVKGQTANGAQAGMLVHQNNIIPQGHVQQMIQRMSPGQAYYHIQQKQQSQTPAQNVPSTQPAISLAAAVSAQQQFNSMNSGTAASSSPNTLLSHQLHDLVLGAHIPSSSSSSTPAAYTTSVFSVQPEGQAQLPPPPYSQACLQVTGVNGGSSGGVPHPAHREQQEAHSVPPVMEVSAMPASTEASQMIHKKMVTPAAVAATRLTMGLHMPVIMPSVRSKEVTKPLPQTATAPLMPPHNVNINGGILSNNIPPVKSHINNMSSLPNQHQPKQNQQMVGSGQLPRGGPPGQDFQIPISHSYQQGLQIGRNGGNYTMEQLAALAGGQSSVASQQQQQSALFHNHIQAMKLHNTAIYQQFSPDAASSTSRSDSPVSRTTNQSPMSVLSSTSSPSTNSDVPDKPPPPYPRRGVVGMGPISNLNPPLLPPRIPLKDKPPPPPPPHSDHGQANQLGGPSHTLHFPPSNGTVLPPSLNSSSSSPSSPLTSSCNTVPVSLQNGAISLHSNINDATQQTDINTVSAPTGKCSHLINPQVVSNMPQTETDETDTGQGHSSTSTKCSTCLAQEKHRCLSPLPERKSEARERDRLRCDTKVKVYSPQAFKFYMEQHVENVLKSHAQRMTRRLQLEKEMTKVKLSDEAAQQMRKMLYQKESNYLRLKRAKMDSSMFDKIQTLGVGAFGEVALVRKKDVGSLYAMKTLVKSNVIKRNQVAHVKAERDILAEADNEWVVKLYYSFQDRDCLYFVMDYVPGGDLMGLLIRKEILEEHLAQFYIAELVLAIESVHKMGFIHRDIKPDNILIDKDGHIKLTDFGLCTGFRWTHNSKYYQK